MLNYKGKSVFEISDSCLKRILLVLICIPFSAFTFAQAPSISYSSPQNYTLNTTITQLSPVNNGGAVPQNVLGQVINNLTTTDLTPANNGALSSGFTNPVELLFDAAQNLYVADPNTLRTITPQGSVAVLAGCGLSNYSQGTGISVCFSSPRGIAIDTYGNIYVADYYVNMIRKVTPAGVVSNFAGNTASGLINATGAAARFNFPSGITIDETGNFFVTDQGNNVIRKITPAGVVSTFAGSGLQGSIDGLATTASFNNPVAITIDNAGNLYVAGKDNLIRKITSLGVVSTLAGNGSAGSGNGMGSGASFNNPAGVVTDGLGNIYISDQGNNQIRMITPTGVVSTLAGTGATNVLGATATFNSPTGITYSNGSLYVADQGGNSIKKILLTAYTIDKPLPNGLIFDTTTGIITGTPIATSPPTDYTITAYNAVGSSSAVVTIAVKAAYVPPVVIPPDISYQTPQVYPVNTSITMLSPQNKGSAVPPNTYTSVTTFAGSGQNGSVNGNSTAASFSGPNNTVVDASGNVYVSDGHNLIRKITPAGVVSTYAGSGATGLTNGAANTASFNSIFGLAIDASGNLYVADANNNVIREISTAGTVSTFAGSGVKGSTDGLSATATFNRPVGLTFDAAGNLYVGDEGSYDIRKIDPLGNVTTFAGQAGVAGSSDGTGLTAQFMSPGYLTADLAGNIYVVDNSNEIRKITPAGVVTTIFTGVPNFGLIGIAIDNAGNIYVSINNLIEKLSGGNLTLIAGQGGTGGAVNGVGSAASFDSPTGLSIDAVGNLFIADQGNSLIREVSLSGYTIDKTLPAGLSFDPITGTINGMPTVVSPATDYTVTAHNINGSSSTIVNIKVVAGFTFAVIPNKTICDADFTPSITGGSGAYALSSSNTAVAVINNGKVHIIGPGNTNIIANDGNTTQQQNLTVIAPIVPSITITPNFFDSCVGLQLTYTANIVNGGTNPTYQWKVNGQNAGTNSSSFTSSILATGDVLTCTLTNNTDCTAGPVTSNTATLSADAYTTPTIIIQSSASGPIKSSDFVTFLSIITNGGNNPIYQWMVNNQNVGTNSPSYSGSCFNDGDIVTCMLTNQGGKCLTTLYVTSNPITLSVTDPLSVIITASASNVYAGTPVTFKAIANNVDVATYQWMVNGVDTGPDSPDFTTSILKNGDKVTCTIKATGGCTVSVASNQIIMTILPSVAIEIPNTFTPNGDGINDLWNISALADYPNCTVNIYSRYGAVIYHSKGYSKPWDGTYNGGKLSVGTYYYVIDLGNNTQKLSGYVALIR